MPRSVAPPSAPRKPDSDRLFVRMYPDEFFDISRSLGPAAATVYAAFHAFADWHDGTTFVTVDRLVRETGIAPRSIKRHIAQLVDAGYIARRPQDGFNEPVTTAIVSYPALSGQGAKYSIQGAKRDTPGCQMEHDRVPNATPDHVANGTLTRDSTRDKDQTTSSSKHLSIQSIVDSWMKMDVFQDALVIGRVPPSAHRKELERVALLASAPTVRDPVPYALAIIRTYWKDPQWEETSSDRIARGLTAVRPG